MLQAALGAGLASEGADVVDVGVLSTPALAWLSVSGGPAPPWSSRPPQPVPGQRDQAVRGRRTKLTEELETGRRGRAPPGPRPGAQRTPTARGPRCGDHPQ